jgi:3-oxoacyl-[acyl-carrier-protein] synthase-3
MTASQSDPGSERAAVICGIGFWLPPSVVTNADLKARLDTSDEWIRSRTGIAARRIASRGTLTSDIAVAAAAPALRSSGDSQVQAVVLATSTPDRLCPATAPVVATRLGLPGVAAFDISAVCTGFLYGLAVASGLVVSGTARRVLLIGADRFSTLLDPRDRATVPIFGDGAGAVVLRQGLASEPGAIGQVILGSDGAHQDLITVRAGNDGAGADDRPASARIGYLEMLGPKVYRHAVKRMSSAAKAAADAAGWTMKDVDRLVAHQANARITAALARDLEISPDRCASNIAEVGNTAAASVPILLAQATADGFLAYGHRVLLTAFGAGLTWGATTLVWPSLGLSRMTNDE